MKLSSGLKKVPAPPGPKMVCLALGCQEIERARIRAMEGIRTTSRKTLQMTMADALSNMLDKAVEKGHLVGALD